MDVLGLGRLIAAGQENDENSSTLCVVHAISGPDIDLQLTDAPSPASSVLSSASVAAVCVNITSIRASSLA